MKKFALLLLLLSGLNSYSQNQYLDYGVTFGGDTIYGTINKRAIRDFSIQNTQSKKKYKEHKLKNFKTIRHNDIIYAYEKISRSIDDGIYANSNRNMSSDSTVVKRIFNGFVNHAPRLEDYIVTKDNDTIYGKIKKPALGIGKEFLIDKNNEKTKITDENIIAYRKDNEIYHNYDAPSVSLWGGSENLYLQLIYDGKVKLYKYTHTYISAKSSMSFNSSEGGSFSSNSEDFYYIYKDDNLYLMQPIGYKKKITELFSDLPDLVSTIQSDLYEYEDLHLVVKFYNQEKKD
jgi:hypothetical protein